MHLEPILSATPDHLTYFHAVLERLYAQHNVAREGGSLHESAEEADLLDHLHYLAIEPAAFLARTNETPGFDS